LPSSDTFKNWSLSGDRNLKKVDGKLQMNFSGKPQTEGRQHSLSGEDGI